MIEERFERRSLSDSKTHVPNHFSCAATVAEGQAGQFDTSRI